MDKSQNSLSTNAMTTSVKACLKGSRGGGSGGRERGLQAKQQSQAVFFLLIKLCPLQLLGPRQTTQGALPQPRPVSNRQAGRRNTPQSVLGVAGPREGGGSVVFLPVFHLPLGTTFVLLAPSIVKLQRLLHLDSHKGFRLLRVSLVTHF